MQNKNILELCLAHGLGGLEMFVAHCNKEFSKNTTCKTVVAPNSKLDNYLEGIDKFYIKRNKFLPFIPALQLAKYIDKHDIDIIHFHWTKDSITAVLAKLFSHKKPKLVQSRHMRMTRFKDDFYHRWLYQNIDLIHAVTKEVSSQLYKFIPTRIRPKIEMVYLGVVPPQIDKTIVKNLYKKYELSNSFVVGIIGRIEEQKAQYKLIEVIAQMNDLNIRVMIVGDAMDQTYLESLKSRVKDLALEQKIVFTGFTKNVNEHIVICDTVVLATENETFGLVVIEAMINKKPVISTDSGGPLEIIEDKVDGLFFDGSVDDLEKKIKVLYESKELVEELGANALKKVESSFNQEKQLDRLYKVLIS